MGGSRDGHRTLDASREVGREIRPSAVGQPALSPSMGTWLGWWQKGRGGQAHVSVLPEDFQWEAVRRAGAEEGGPGLSFPQQAKPKGFAPD